LHILEIAIADLQICDGFSGSTVFMVSEKSMFIGIFSYFCGSVALGTDNAIDIRRGNN